MKIDLILGRTIELGLAGIARYVLESMHYRRMTGGISKAVASALEKSELPAEFDGCIRAVLSFCLEDESRIDEILVRRAKNDWIFLMELDMSREVYHEIGSSSVPLVVGTLLEVALQLAQTSRPVGRADLLRAAAGMNGVTDTFLSSIRERAARAACVELEVVFDCSQGLGTEAEIELRHTIEQVLNDGLAARGFGEAVGGSAGGGEMEVHIETNSERKATKLILQLLETHGLPKPKRIERIQ